MDKIIYGIGRRKEATAKVILQESETGTFSLNGQSPAKYLTRDPILLAKVQSPFECLGITNQYSIIATVKGGGISGQADAVTLALSKALAQVKESFKIGLRTNKLLTTDARVVERKKYGLKKARKAPQFSKR